MDGFRSKRLPGSYYSVNQDKIFPIENEYGIPTMAGVSTNDIDLSLPLLEYRSKEKDGICHFFLDDYRFESVWNHPSKALKAVLSYKCALSPDFSSYVDWPIAINLWNTYRNRWCGRLWQEYGQTVIPTVGWASEQSYKFSFLGIPKGSIVAIGFFRRMGIEQGQFFFKGYEELIKQVDPEKVLVYSSKFIEELKDDRIIIKETFWQRKAKLEKGK